MNEFHVSFPNLGWEFTINRVAFSIGSFQVYWYGLIIATGLILALVYAHFSAKRYNVDGSKLMNCVFAGIITGIIGARLYFCIFKWDYYGSHPLEIFAIHEGGLAIYGGIIGALLGGLGVAKIQKMKFMPILDITMVGFLIGQGLGRWGNFFNQEAYGTPTDLPWGMMSEGTLGETVHPSRARSEKRCIPASSTNRSGACWASRCCIFTENTVRDTRDRYSISISCGTALNA